MKGAILTPSIKWTTIYKVKKYHATKGLVSEDEKGDCLLVYLKSKKDVSAVKTLDGIKESRFKGRLGLRTGPMLLLFIRKPHETNYRAAPIVIDDHFINKWSSELVPTIKDMTLDQFFVIGLRNKYLPNKTFKPLLSKWFETHVAKQ